MNLSRAAKKFRAHTPHEPVAARPARAGQMPKTPPAPIPVPEPVAAPPPPPEPIPEPVAPIQAVEPPPPKAWPVKTKRPRFVREKAEPQDRPATPALPPRSTKLTARLLTRNLTLLPKDDAVPSR